MQCTWIGCQCLHALTFTSLNYLDLMPAPAIAAANRPVPLPAAVLDLPADSDWAILSVG